MDSNIPKYSALYKRKKNLPNNQNEKRRARETLRRQSRFDHLAKKRAVDVSSECSVTKPDCTSTSIINKPIQSTIPKPLPSLAKRLAKLEQWKMERDEMKRKKKKETQPPFVFKKITFQMPVFLTSDVKFSMPSNSTQKTILNCPATPLFKKPLEPLKGRPVTRSQTKLPSTPTLKSSKLQSFKSESVSCSKEKKDKCTPSENTLRKSFAPDNFLFKPIQMLGAISEEDSSIFKKPETTRKPLSEKLLLNAASNVSEAVEKLNISGKIATEKMRTRSSINLISFSPNKK